MTAPLRIEDFPTADDATLRDRQRYLQGLNLAGRHRVSERAELVRVEIELERRRKRSTLVSTTT